MKALVSYVIYPVLIFREYYIGPISRKWYSYQCPLIVFHISYRNAAVSPINQLLLALRLYASRCMLITVGDFVGEPTYAK